MAAKAKPKVSAPRLTKEAYIRFMAPVTSQTSMALLRTIVRSVLFPAEFDLSVINEDGSQLSFKQIPIGVEPLAKIGGTLQHSTAPAAQAFTESVILNHGTFFSS